MYVYPYIHLSIYLSIYIYLCIYIYIYREREIYVYVFVLRATRTELLRRMPEATASSQRLRDRAKRYGTPSDSVNWQRHRKMTVIE